MINLTYKLSIGLPFKITKILPHFNLVKIGDQL